MTLGPIINGKDFNFFRRVTVVSTSFSSDCNIVINITGQEGFTMHNEGTGIVEYSFNGNTVHGDMDSTKDSKTLKFDHRRVSKIWFRIKTGSSIPVRFEAWAAK